MKIFACSDHHFYHKNIIKYAERPFPLSDDGVVENAKLMIERHNEVVSDDDVVLFVGDISASLKGRDSHFSELLKLLKGKKILIRGNHDHLPDNFYIDSGFIKVLDYISIDGYFISHYPCYKSRWTQQVEKNHIKVMEDSGIETIIHGHIHNKNPNDWEPDGYNRINVCIDYTPNNFYPVELKIPNILEYFKSFILS